MSTNAPNDQWHMTTERATERGVAPEIRVKGSERLHVLENARDNILLHLVQEPVVTVSAPESVKVTEANPVAAHIVSTAPEAAPVVTAEISPATLDPTNVEAIRAQVADLADQSQSAQSARDEYGIAA